MTQAFTSAIGPGGPIARVKDWVMSALQADFFYLSE